jgi:hypothetical protein
MNLFVSKLWPKFISVDLLGFPVPCISLENIFGSDDLHN